MKYYFFLDESGDHGLSFIDKNFPFFLLCGCLFSEQEEGMMNQLIKAIKEKFFRTSKIIFHSRDIRKCEKEFQILFNLNVKNNFYTELNKIITEINFNIIATAIQKE